MLNDGRPLLAFALWEAKKSNGDSHWSALTQLDKEVRHLPTWQSGVISEASSSSNEFFPVVWAFTNVGSSWTVYGCYESIYEGDEVHFGVSFEPRSGDLGRWITWKSIVELWSGNVSDKNKSLQLHWIVDIIKFWAEYTYKHMIGACLSRINPQTDNEDDEVPLGETSWKYHIVLNKENTPWFFHHAKCPRDDKNLPANSLSVP